MMDRRGFLKQMVGLALATPVLVQPERVYSFLWNNPLASQDPFTAHVIFYMDFMYQPSLNAIIGHRRWVESAFLLLPKDA